jgi:hypothetical protein
MSALVCPSCRAGSFGGEERFCPACGTPLVLANSEPKRESRRRRELRERARKIKPQYTEGELVSVARAQHQAEAELIQGILLEEGIPSLVRRNAGFDVPDFLAAGPRDVLVPESGLQAARQALTELASGGAGDTGEV